MRLAAAVLSALLATSCSAATTAVAPAAAAPDAPLLTSEGGVLRPIDNGGRIALHSGYATVRLSPSPQDLDPQLQVSLFNSSGQPMTGDVSVDYESLDMDHGMTVAQGVLHEGCYRMGLSFGMAGRWRLVIHVMGGGSEEQVVLVLPWVGL